MDWHRREVMAGTIATMALAGCLGGDDEDTSDQEPSERAAEAEERIEAYDLVDYTGEDPVQIDVDPDGDRFDPEGFVIDSRTVIEWTWQGDSEDIYPIAMPEACEWRGEDGEFTAGDSWDRLFWAEGAYIYGSRDADGEEFTGAFRVREAEDDEGEEISDDGMSDDSGM